MNPKARKAFYTICLIAYVAVLVKFIVFKYPDDMTREILRIWSPEGLMRHIQATNVIPFRTILNSLFNDPLRAQVMALIYNIAAFLPLGLLLPLFSEKTRTWRAVLIIGLGISLALELVQMMTLLGEADIDDILLNVTGAGIGFGVFQLALVAYRKIVPSAGSD